MFCVHGCDVRKAAMCGRSCVCFLRVLRCAEPCAVWMFGEVPLHQGAQGSPSPTPFSAPVRKTELPRGPLLGAPAFPAPTCQPVAHSFALPMVPDKPLVHCQWCMTAACPSPCPPLAGTAEVPDHHTAVTP